MKRIIKMGLVGALLYLGCGCSLSTSVCLAAGWNDFTRDIGDGYAVFKANSMDVGICRADGRLILCPRNHDKIGPVVGYMTTHEYILTKNLGRKPRNLFEGDALEEVDPAQEHFFIIVKATEELRGPYSEEEVMARSEVAEAGAIKWQVPTNPDAWRSLGGSLLFLAFAVPILAVKYYWITIPLIAGTILLFRKRAAFRVWTKDLP